MINSIALTASVLGLASSLAWGQVPAQTPGCAGLAPQSQYNPPLVPTEGCECGLNLRNVSLTLRKPFQLRAACNLYWFGANGRVTIDLSHEKVSYDKFDKNGALPFGQLLLAGKTKLRGTLMFYPGDAGQWWFYLADPIGQRDPAASLLGGLKLWKEHGFEEFRVPVQLRGAECWSAAATIEVHDIWLTVGDTDESGAYPSRYRIQNISKHQLCK